MYKALSQGTESFETVPVSSQGSLQFSREEQISWDVSNAKSQSHGPGCIVAYRDAAH